MIWYIGGKWEVGIAIVVLKYGSLKIGWDDLLGKFHNERVKESDRFSFKFYEVRLLLMDIIIL